MLYVDRAEVQHAALQHWKENLRRTIEMDWEVFKKRRSEEGIWSLLKGQVAGYPAIFGKYCSYCIYMRAHFDDFHWENRICEGCPLHDDDAGDDCSNAWSDVRKAFEYADFQSEAILACTKMLRKIEEEGDQWSW